MSRGRKSSAGSSDRKERLQSQLETRQPNEVAAGFAGHVPCRVPPFVSRRALFSCLVVLCAGPSSARGAEQRAAPPAASRRCEAAYADDFAALKAEAREFDRR